MSPMHIIMIIILYSSTSNYFNMLAFLSHFLTFIRRVLLQLWPYLNLISQSWFFYFLFERQFGSLTGHWPTQSSPYPHHEETHLRWENPLVQHGTLIFFLFHVGLEPKTSLLYEILGTSPQSLGTRITGFSFLLLF